VAPLDGTLALAEDFDIAVVVGHQLEFDVARAFDELFAVQVGAGEGAAGLLLGLVEHVRQFFGGRTTRMPRPPPPALALRMTG
jgi:hypothetical protein